MKDYAHLSLEGFKRTTQYRLFLRILQDKSADPLRLTFSIMYFVITVDTFAITQYSIPDLFGCS